MAERGDGRTTKTRKKEKCTTTRERNKNFHLTDSKKELRAAAGAGEDEHTHLIEPQLIIGDKRDGFMLTIEPLITVMRCAYVSLIACLLSPSR